jgi:hypothetical protein
MADLLRLGAVAGAAAAAVVLMGAAPGTSPPLPVAPESREARMARMLPTPRLFEITTVIDGKTNGPALICESAESMLRRTQAVPARAPAAAADAKSSLAGCRHTFERRPNGAAHIEMICDKAAGAPRDMRSIADLVGEMQDVRHHLEVTYDGPPPRKMVMDSHTVMKGDCPADLRPGEMRLADGTKVDARTRTPAAADVGVSGAHPHATPKP